MLPSRPKIQPVKGGANRDQVSAGWGNGVISLLHLTDESGAYSYQDVTTVVDGIDYAYSSVFGKSLSQFGPNVGFACGNVLHESGLPELEHIAADSAYSYLVTDEILPTSDYIVYQSVHGTVGDSNSDWLKSPQPVITVNGSTKNEGTDYTVDYANGKVTFAVKTRGSSTLSQDTNSGAMAIDVASNAGFQAGDLITIEGNTSGQDEQRTVTQLLPGKLLFSSALTYSHSAGKGVAEPEPVVKSTYRYIEQHTSKWTLNAVGSVMGLLPSSYADRGERVSGGVGILRLKNPTFANWTNNLPDSWGVTGDGTGTIGYSTGLLSDKCLKIQVTANTGYYVATQIYSQPISGTVKFSCWVKTQYKVKLVVATSEGQTGTAALDAQIAQADFSNKWVRLEAIATGTSPFVVSIFAQNQPTDGGLAFFDGATLAIE